MRQSILDTASVGAECNSVRIAIHPGMENAAVDHEIAVHLNPTIPKVDMFLPEALKDAVFVGHLVTDLDSVAGAIGAAALYGRQRALWKFQHEFHQSGRQVDFRTKGQRAELQPDAGRQEGEGLFQKEE